MATKFLDYTGLSHFCSKFKEWCNSIFVTKATDENITGTKTFIGSKKIAFKQSGANDKLGFTLFNNSGKEQGYLEYNPTNKIAGIPLMMLGNYATAADELTYVGFRRYSNISGASGAYNLLTPLISDAKTPFNLTTTYTNFYLPLGISDGTNIITASNSGIFDISSLLSSISTIGWSDVTSKPTTISGYGITDAKIDNGTITLGSNSIMPLISHQDISGKVNKAGDTMTGDLRVPSLFFDYGVYKKHPDIVKGTNPSEIKFWTLANCDKNGVDYANNMLGVVETSLIANGIVSTYMRAIKNEAGSTANGTLGIAYDTTNNYAYTFAPTPATADNTTKIATTAFVKAQGYLTSHQDISGKVNKSGDTMTGGLTITNSNTLKLKHTGITRGTAPSAAVYPFFVEFKDSADKTLGGLYYEYFTNKGAKTHLMCYQGTTNANTWNSIGVGYDASGNVFTWAPTPATSDNSTKIATTAFVKAQGYLTSHQSLANYSTLANTVKSISISGRTITVTPGSGSAYTLTTQDNNTTYSAATQSANGLMSAADKKKLDGIEAGADNIPVGTVIYYAKSTVPTNFLICNGGAVSRTTYATLFGVIGTTFGTGNGSSTFNVPNLIGRFPEGNATPGTVHNAGLPNITGTLGDCATGSASGCFSRNADSSGWNRAANDDGSGGSRFGTITLSAKSSNSIYGNSSTVQPPALTLVPCIRYA